MLIGITGTPGTGKTSVSKILEIKGFTVIDLNSIVEKNNLIVSKDKLRDSYIVDTDKLNNFFKDFKDDDLTFIDGHLSHFIDRLDKVILLRCKPEKLKKNLSKKNWPEKKINENVESEILDIILSECVENYSEEDIFEIDTSNYDVIKVSEIILDIIDKNFKNIKKYKIGKIDWSEHILEDF